MNGGKKSRKWIEMYSHRNVQSTVEADGREGEELMSEIRGNPFWLAIAVEDPRSQFRFRYCSHCRRPGLLFFTFPDLPSALPFSRQDILEGIMENVSSDAGIKATQAVKFPLPGGNYTNY